MQSQHIDIQRTVLQEAIEQGNL